VLSVASAHRHLRGRCDWRMRQAEHLQNSDYPRSVRGEQRTPHVAKNVLIHLCFLFVCSINNRLDATHLRNLIRTSNPTQVPAEAKDHIHRSSIAISQGSLSQDLDIKKQHEALKKMGNGRGGTIREITLQRKSPSTSTAQLQQYPSGPRNHTSDIRRVETKRLGEREQFISRSYGGKTLWTGQRPRARPSHCRELPTAGLPSFKDQRCLHCVRY